MIVQSLIQNWQICGLVGFICMQSSTFGQLTGLWETWSGCELVRVDPTSADRINITHQDNQYHFRLYFVEALPADESSRHAAIAATYQASLPIVTEQGQRAVEWASKTLAEPFQLATCWEDARSGSPEQAVPIYFAYITTANGTDLGTEMVGRGFARIHGMPSRQVDNAGNPPFVYLNQLKQAWQTAQNRKKGIWQSTSSLPHQTTRPVVVRAPRIPINTANADTLQTLPGIGPVLAQRIIELRPFDSIDDLLEIKGIHHNSLEALRPLLQIDTTETPESQQPSHSDRETSESWTTVVINRIERSEQPSPEGTYAIRVWLQSSLLNQQSLVCYVPEERLPQFVEQHKVPGQSCRAILRIDDEMPSLHQPQM